MRKFWITLIGLAFISGLVFAQTPEEKFQKVAQEELGWREHNLSFEKAGIEEFHARMVYRTDSAFDYVISGKEMRTLKKMVKHFDKIKKKYDKELEFYELKTSTEIKPVIREHLKIYFVTSEKEFYYCDNNKQEIRRYFVQNKGYDVSVEKSKMWGFVLFVGLLVALVIGFVCVIVIYVLFDHEEAAWIVGIIIFVTFYFLVAFLI